jgi:cytochrome c oxidase assembly protein Cox11
VVEDVQATFLYERCRKEATMGLDAFVRCRCFDEEKLKPRPVPVEYLYIDNDGHHSSRKLDEE